MVYRVRVRVRLTGCLSAFSARGLSDFPARRLQRNIGDPRVTHRRSPSKEVTTKSVRARCDGGVPGRNSSQGTSY